MTRKPLINDASAERIYPLTSMRFFAALYVVMFHWLRLVPIKLNSGFLFRFVSFGGISVSFFYLLSGYILARVYLHPGRGLEKWRFYAARFARIYPIFFLTLLADLPWYLLSQKTQYGIPEAFIRAGSRFIGSLFMLQAWSPAFRGINFPNWSLSVETLFYAIFPFVGFLLWRLRGMRIWTVMLLVYITGQALVVLALVLAGNDFIAIDEMLYFPPLHVSTFLLGILLACLQVFSIEGNERAPIKTWKVYAVLGLSMAVYLAIIQFTSDDLVRSGRGSVIFRDGLLAPIFCGAIWAVSSGNTLPSRLLGAKWLVLLGESSYGLYLIHFPVLHALARFYGLSIRAKTHAEFAVRYSLSFLVFLALCISLSISSFRWIEGPARKWILEFLKVRSRETLEVASDAQ
jgi:peptidoglycan/LPS O-acetylase OafA/YrhL